MAPCPMGAHSASCHPIRFHEDRPLGNAAARAALARDGSAPRAGVPTPPRQGIVRTMTTNLPPRKAAPPGPWHTEGARWNALRRRDLSADGSFFYSVETTGIYCYPSCPARLPKPQNVAFHGSRQLAEAAGFRPCRRCRSDLPPRVEREAAQAVQLCRLIDDSCEEPPLEQLAAHIGYSPSAAHRMFKRATGITPKAYAAARRAQRLREELTEDSGSVASAIYGAGYGSSGRLYEKSDQLLGMTPSAFRRGGDNVAIRFAVGECSLGSVLVASTDKGVCSVLLGDHPEPLVHDLERRFPRATLRGADGDFETLVARVVGLIDGPSPGSSPLPLDIRGTAFQRRVWTALAQIPRGQRRTYSQVAEAIGAPGSARAVAGACAANPVAVVIPCHRVVRRDGTLSGYRWGIERKRSLLAREEKHSEAT